MAHKFFQLSVDQFFERYLNVQTINNEVLEGCLQCLRNDGHILVSDAGEHWKQFPNRPYALSEDEKVRSGTRRNVNEGAVFRGLQDLAEAIVNAARSIDPINFGEDRQTTDLLCTGENKVVSEITGSIHRPDAWFRLRNSSVPSQYSPPMTSCTPERERTTYMADIAAYGEFRLKDGILEFEDDIRKVIYAAVHGMQNDPRRRHMFTFTIEDATTRLWFYGRSHSIQTEPFDFCKDFKTSIRTILSFCFAPEKTLGYDPTVTRILDDEKRIRYVYAVKDKFYLTRKWLSEYHATSIPGRATRVMSVIECEDAEGNDADESKTAVLKDVYLDVDAKSELQQQMDIYDALDQFALEDNSAILECMSEEESTKILEDIRQKKYKEYFMTIIADEPVNIDGVPDVTPSPPTEGDAIVLDVFREPHSRGSQMEGSARSNSFTSDMSNHLVGVWTLNASEARNVAARTHRRVVFKEYCQDVTSVEDFNDFLQALEHGLQALQYLYLVGYVHRDVSGGNLLFHHDTKQGKLSDLEYVKAFPPAPGEEHDRNSKTGTPAFMPVEIHMGTYLSFSEAIFDDSVPAENDDDTHVRHNYLHDVESVFWLFLWGVCNRVIVDDKPDVHELRRLFAWTATVFPYSTTCSFDRSATLTLEHYAAKNLRQLKGINMRAIAQQISKMRSALWKRYQTLGKKSLRKHRPAYATCHREMREIISAGKKATTRKTSLLEVYLKEQEKYMKTIK